jgi:hypothetical protein
LDRPQVLPLHVLEHADVEHLGDVPEAGDLVRAGPLGEDLARVAQPQGFLGGEPALALHEGALNLPVVDGRVDGTADIHLDVAAEVGPVPGQRVDLDFGDGGALRKVKVHQPGVLLPLVTEIRGCVESVGGEVDTVKVSRLGEFLHGGVRTQLLPVGLETRVDLLAGIVNGVTIEVGGGGGCGGGCVCNRVGCSFRDEDVINWHAEGFGGDHGHLCMESLPHFRSTVGDEDGAIVVYMNQSAGLVEEESCKGDAELCRNEGKPTLLPFVGRVEFVYCFATGFIVCLFLELLYDEGDVIVDELLVEVGGVALLVVVDLLSTTVSINSKCMGKRSILSACQPACPVDQIPPQ